MIIFAEHRLFDHCSCLLRIRSRSQHHGMKFRSMESQLKNWRLDWEQVDGVFEARAVSCWIQNRIESNFIISIDLQGRGRTLFHTGFRWCDCRRGQPIIILWKEWCFWRHIITASIVWGHYARISERVVWSARCVLGFVDHEGRVHWNLIHYSMALNLALFFIAVNY